MNTYYEYRRRTDRSLMDMQDRAALQPESPPIGAERSIVWVRPSELATTVTAPTLRRSLDLQTELVRRGRRTPDSARRAARRISRSATSRIQPTPQTEEGMRL